MKRAPFVWMAASVIATLVLVLACLRVVRAEEPASSCFTTPRRLTQKDSTASRQHLPDREPAPQRQSETQDEPPSIVELEARLTADALSQDPNAICRQLAQHGGEAGVSALVRATHAPRDSVREAAWSALSQLDDEPTRRFMLAELEGASVRRAVDYFKNCRDEHVIVALERVAARSAPELAGAAVEALLAQGAPAHASLLRLAASDSDAAESVFAQAGSVLTLRPSLRAACVTGLHLGKGYCIGWLTGDRSAQARAALVSAASDPALRQAALAALNQRGDPASIAALAELGRGQDSAMACDARFTLLHDVDSRSHSTLVALALPSRWLQTTEALLQIGAPEGTRALRALLRSPNERQRWRALHLLANFGPRDSDRILLGMQQDPSESLRAVATRVLEVLNVR
ncbi:MAG: HEAT repeat domain-containing protein [Myxococcota bacterium]